MAAPTALTQSMHNISTTKLAALAEQYQRYETEKSQTLQTIANQEVPAGVLTLLDAFERCKISVPSDISARNVRRFLKQGHHDPSICPDLIKEWHTTLQKALDVPSRKYEHASLFGRLIMEWLDTIKEASRGSPGSEKSDHFEHVGRKEMYDQRKEWESIVFADHSKSDPAAIESYLAGIFGSTTRAKKLIKTPIQTLKESMGAFELGYMTIDRLKICIQGVLSTDLLVNEKRKTLTEFLGNELVLQEMVDVLNIQIDALDSWSWGEEAIPVDVRRALNGKYRVYMDEEILQALLLHFIGMKWGVHLKTTFLAFFNSGAWKQSSRHSLNKEARERRQEMLGPEPGNHRNVRNERRDRYQRDYFLLQLPSTCDVKSDNYDGGSSYGASESKSPMAIKQSLFHLLSTESLINAWAYGSFTILQSDFRWFGRSMPHATIMAVLHFFGVPERWLKFFVKFLEAPIKFTMDGPDGQTRIRRSGVPIQHKLGDAMGEAVLFCLDFAINKATETNLYRLHDDIWFWGDKTASITAWQTIQKFSDVMGLRLNEGKTGAVELSGSPLTACEFSSSDGLPSGPITWGFLKLGHSGQWIVDDKQIEVHINEIRTQLEACDSILAWIQAWNAYAARFTSNNLGESANCLGRPHLDMAIAAFEKIQCKLFAADNLKGKNVTEHLKAKLSEKFGVEDVPDGFFYFPTELGGLALVNPFIPLFCKHESSLENPNDTIDKAFEEEKEAYEREKKAFAMGTYLAYHRKRAKNDGDDDEFLSFDEYTKYREETSVPLYEAYIQLLDTPSETWVESKTDTVAPYDSAYHAWMVQLYGPDVIRKYGGLAMGEKRLLPIGLADLLRKEKVRWQG